MADVGKREFVLHWVDGLSWEAVGREVGLGKAKARAAKSRAWRWSLKNQHEAQQLRFGTTAEQEEPEPQHSPETATGEKAGFRQISANVVELSCAGQRIASLDELLAYHSLSRDDWRIMGGEVNYYEGQQRYEHTNLRYTNGAASGTVKRDGALIVPMHGIRAKFVRREPVAVFPAVQPVRLTATYQERHETSTQCAGALLMFDPHIGFRKDQRNAKLTPLHDRAALDALLQLVSANPSIDTVVFGGDLLDMAECSDKFVREPEFYWTLQPALIECAWWLAQFRRFARVIVLSGNHDARLRAGLLKHYPAAYDLERVRLDGIKMPPVLSVPELLGVQALDVSYIDDYPDGRYRLSAGLQVLHGAVARSTPGATARAIAESEPLSSAFGHIHRREWVTIQRGRGDIDAVCPGCLCHVDYRVPGHKRGQHWQQGALVVRNYGEHFSANVVSIADGEALAQRVYNGVGLASVSELQRIAPEYNW